MIRPPARAQRQGQAGHPVCQSSHRSISRPFALPATVANVPCRRRSFARRAGVPAANRGEAPPAKPHDSDDVPVTSYLSPYRCLLLTLPALNRSVPLSRGAKCLSPNTDVPPEYRFRSRLPALTRDKMSVPLSLCRPIFPRPAEAKTGAHGGSAAPRRRCLPIANHLAGTTPHADPNAGQGEASRRATQGGQPAPAPQPCGPIRPRVAHEKVAAPLARRRRSMVSRTYARVEGHGRDHPRNEPVHWPGPSARRAPPWRARDARHPFGPASPTPNPGPVNNPGRNLPNGLRTTCPDSLVPTPAPGCQAVPHRDPHPITT